MSKLQSAKCRVPELPRDECQVPKLPRAEPFECHHLLCCANDHIVRERMLMQGKESEMKFYRHKKVLEELQEQLKFNKKIIESN